MALDIVAVLVLTPLDVQIAFGVRPSRNVVSTSQVQSTAPDVEILRAFEPIVRYTQGEKFFPMDVERYLREASLWLYVPDGSDQEVVPEGELTLGEPRAAARGALRVALLPALHPGTRPPGERAGARRRAEAREGAAEHVPRRCRPTRARRAPAADRRRALLPLAAPARERPRRDGGRSRAEVRTDPPRGREVHLPGPRRAAERLDDLPVLVLLRLQPVALGLPRGERPRGGLGDGLRLPLRGRGAARPRVDRVCLARLPRRRPAPALGRRHRPPARGRAPGRVRGCRVARLVLQGGRVPGGGADPGSGAREGVRPGVQRVLAHDARPG